MIEPRPLRPPDLSESLPRVTVSFTCPKGHLVDTACTQSELNVLKEHSDLGENYLNLKCPKCRTDFRVEL